MNKIKWHVPGRVRGTTVLTELLIIKTVLRESQRGTKIVLLTGLTNIHVRS